MNRVMTDLNSGWTLRADATPVAFSAHAVERAQERMSPGLDAPAIRHALSGMLVGAKVTRNPPPWCERQRADAWLVIGEDIVCPLRWRAGELRVTTMLSRGAMSPQARSHRNTVRASRTKGKLTAKRRGRGRGVGPAGPSAQEWDGDA
jgi:hypothetical protein